MSRKKLQSGVSIKIIQDSCALTVLYLAKPYRKSFKKMSLWKIVRYAQIRQVWQVYDILLSKVPCVSKKPPNEVKVRIKGFSVSPSKWWKAFSDDPPDWKACCCELMGKSAGRGDVQRGIRQSIHYFSSLMSRKEVRLKGLRPIPARTVKGFISVVMHLYIWKCLVFVLVSNGEIGTIF